MGNVTFGILLCSIFVLISSLFRLYPEAMSLIIALVFAAWLVWFYVTLLPKE